ncbi:hypothetical protein MNEG_3152 [Monoraphidium neglectum]|uniref:Myb-like domain-containing protein n=1 Tax=Monoraphidium neglectum TaxID=145388 RepID=A0A0D2LDL7_9CHLO|nr:hypothetical protein MNEG_3152 [Monoraphidium neglectum]KIZ04799.1 hypothetical protein MNEG_3152 [Monoraphidium neglectum]|eukprot:XP_013903818.1 hypothetical protein MNEG_3152 [Monoraphidium neglectum]
MRAAAGHVNPGESSNPPDEPHYAEAAPRAPPPSAGRGGAGAAADAAAAGANSAAAAPARRGGGGAGGERDDHGGFDADGEDELQGPYETEVDEDEEDEEDSDDLALDLDLGLFHSQIDEAIRGTQRAAAPAGPAAARAFPCGRRGRRRRRRSRGLGWGSGSDEGASEDIGGSEGETDSSDGGSGSSSSSLGLSDLDSDEEVAAALGARRHGHAGGVGSAVAWPRGLGPMGGAGRRGGRGARGAGGGGSDSGGESGGHTGAPNPLRSRHWVGTFNTGGTAAPAPAPGPAPVLSEPGASGAEGAGEAVPAGDPGLQMGAFALRFLPPNSEAREVAEKLPFLQKMLDGQLGRRIRTTHACVQALERRPDSQLAAGLEEFKAKTQALAQLDASSREASARIQQAAAELTPHEWRAVAVAVGRGRTGPECKEHWLAARSEGATRPWGPQERQLLMQLVQQHGRNGQWEAIAAALGTGRPASACLRFFATQLGGAAAAAAAAAAAPVFTPQMDDELRRLVEAVGPRWRLIGQRMGLRAKQVGGRCKRRPCCGRPAGVGRCSALGRRGRP